MLGKTSLSTTKNPTSSSEITEKYFSTALKVACALTIISLMSFLCYELFSQVSSGFSGKHLLQAGNPDLSPLEFTVLCIIGVIFLMLWCSLAASNPEAAAVGCCVASMI